MASAFFFGELGAGLFFVSLLLESAQGMLAGLLITGLLKTYFHLSHMGVPKKSWRAILRPDRSWISRGLIGMSVSPVSAACTCSMSGATSPASVAC